MSFPSLFRDIELGKKVHMVEILAQKMFQGNQFNVLEKNDFIIIWTFVESSKFLEAMMQFPS